jgi:hypothetical protein
MPPENLDVRDDAPTFPGPRTLLPSRKKWRSLTYTSALLTAIGVVMVAPEGGPLGVLAAAFFGLCTAAGAVALLPGSGSLRLDASGFEVTKFFLFKRRYDWRDASDFSVWSPPTSGIVVFRVETEPPSALDRVNGALTGGKSGYLPDTYGMAADDLTRLMTSWREAAVDAPSPSRT